MTNGSSQGLFIIVAVVIFGILVSISYILFRDTLQPSLANIFKDSTDNAILNVNNEFMYKGEIISLNNHLDPSKVNPHIFDDNSSTINKINKKGISYNINAVNKSRWLGLKIYKHGEMKEGSRFLVSFTVEMLKGESTTLGGHTNGFGTVSEIYVNDVEYKREWLEHPLFVMKEGSVNEVKFFIDISANNDAQDPNFYIQVDRGFIGKTNEYNILDIKFQKVKDKR